MGTIATINTVDPDVVASMNGVTASAIATLNGQDWPAGYTISATNTYMSCGTSTQTMNNYITANSAWTATIPGGDPGWLVDFTASGAAGTNVAADVEVQTNTGELSRVVTIRYYITADSAIYVDVTYCQDGNSETCG